MIDAVDQEPDDVPSDLIRVYKPNSWAQARSGISMVPEMLYSGRYGSAKTRTLCEKADLRCRSYSQAPVVAARKKRPHLAQTVLPVFMEEVILPHERSGWRRAADGGSVFRYPNGSFILFAGLDNPAALRSGQFEMVLIDQAEEMEADEWDAAKGRLRYGRGRPRQIAGFCNPGGPTHWLHRRFRPDLGSHIQFSEREMRMPGGVTIPAGRPMRETILAGPSDNLENLDEDYQFVLAGFEGITRERYVLGRWVAAEGSVFGEFSADVHVVMPPASWSMWGGYPPPDWTRVLGIDLGYDNPFVCLFCAIDGDGRWYVYREIYRSHRTIREHKKQITELLEAEAGTLRARAASNGRPDVVRRLARGVPLDTVACDHDAGERAELDDEPMPLDTVPAHKDVTAAIQTIKTMMIERRLFLVRDALVDVDWRLKHGTPPRPTCLAEELPGLIWDKHKDVPVKSNDHGFDALRYAISTHGRQQSPY